MNFKDSSILKNSSNVFLMLDELVEMEVTKPKSCGKDNTEDVVTTVIFQCETDSKNVSNAQPYLPN